MFLFGTKITRKRTPRFLVRYLIRHPSALLGVIATLFFLVLAFLDFFFPYYLGVSNAQNLHSFSNLLTNYKKPPQPPSISKGLEYLFGTTYLGLPMLPVIFASIGTDIEYSFFIVFTSMIVGTLVGVVAAFFGSKTDLLAMRGADIFLSFPAILIVILYSSAEGWNYINISIGIIIIWWTSYARISRSATLPLKNANFVEASISSGCSKTRVIFTHIIPNIASEILVQMTLDLGMVISIFATVNFLFSGLNVTDAFLPEIGNMMVGFPEAAVITAPNYWGGGPPSASFLLAVGIWWPIVIPGLFLILFVISVNLAGDGLRDYINPLTRG